MTQPSASDLLPAPTIESLATSACGLLKKQTGDDASLVVAAPGRVNVIGEHTDYNAGFVLPMAIDRYTVVAAAGNATGDSDRPTIGLRSATFPGEVVLPLRGEDDPGAPAWAAYARGVLTAYEELGIRPAPFDAAIDSSVPLGGGLSSSAALEVALALCVERFAGVELSGAERAIACQRAEHLAGTPCGIMDQFASACCVAEHLMLLDCRDRSTTMHPLDDPSVTVLITNSEVKHELTGGEYADRRAQCEAAAEQLGVPSL
ncbi:MAG: galactokinase family protein, partial [Planctomycetota bacterium]